MNLIEKIKTKIAGLTIATGKFPLTTVFLVAAAITNIIDINSPERYRVYIISLVVGAFLSATGQITYECFLRTRLIFDILLWVYCPYNPGVLSDCK